MIRLLVASFLFLVASSLPAATSYLLLEGNFGPSHLFSTYELDVQYAGTQLITGQDLMNTIFGIPDLSSTAGVPVGGHIYGSSNTIGGVTYAAQYTYFDGFGYAPDSFTIGGLQSDVAGNPNPNFFWNYLNAGGGYNDITGFTDPAVGPYPAGDWTFANTGFSGRTLADQSGTGAASFDALVFGQFGVTPSATPTNAAFAGATVINLTSTPEPGRMMLLFLGGIVAWARRRR